MREKEYPIMIEENEQIKTEHAHPEVLGSVAVVETVGVDTEDFEQWEAELQEQKSMNEMESIKSGKLVHIGKFSDIPGSGKWYGSISPLERIKSGILNKERLDKAILPEYADESTNLSRFFVKIEQGAKIRCIDGRGVLGYVSNDPELYGSGLGPQVAGGTLGQASAWRLAEGGTQADYEAADIESDADRLTDAAQALGYEAGGHIDDHTINADISLEEGVMRLSAEGHTGCGAVDGILDDLNRLASEDDIGSVETLTRAILDQVNLYNQDDFDVITARAVKLKAAKGYFRNKVNAVKKLIERKRDSIVRLAGSHNEAALCINYVEGTTFHTSEFSTANGNDIQAFNYDIWHTIHIAKELYPENEVMASRYIHARTAMAVATSKRLMSDSVELVMRLPQAVEMEASQPIPEAVVV